VIVSGDNVSSTINGPVRITGAGAVRICGTVLNGLLTVTGTRGPVVLGAAGAPCLRHLRR
jgi:hypothetical protein